MKISQNFIFDHPTIRELSQTISSLINPSSDLTTTKNPVDEIKHFIDKYTAGLELRESPTLPVLQGQVTVLLTGSTGNLGSHVVAALLSDARVSRVYTFDRAASGTTPQKRLESAFEDRGLLLSLLSTEKIVNLTGDLNEENFGLSEKTYDEVYRFYIQFLLFHSPFGAGPEFCDSRSA